MLDWKYLNVDLRMWKKALWIWYCSMVCHPFIDFFYKHYKSLINWRIKLWIPLAPCWSTMTKFLVKRTTQEILSLPTQEREKTREAETLTMEVQEEEAYIMTILKEDED